jgi:formylglycine-generating enzyme required for sulfatase activity
MSKALNTASLSTLDLGAVREGGTVFGALAAMTPAMKRACHRWLLPLFTGLASLAQAQVGERVELADWAIDRTEVTIGQFARFVQATGTTTQAERDGGGFEYVGGWQRRPGWTWRAPDGQADADPRLPAVHLTHAEARAYCRWAGGDLPSAAQWLSAAYTEQRAAPPAPFVRGRSYPWPTGAQPDGANTSLSDPWPRAAPAGTTRAGVNGLFDMGANVWEWALDARGNERRTLGGSWWYGPSQMAADVEAWKSADFVAVYIGFRCAYPAQRR